MGKLKSKPKDSKNCSRALRILSEKLKITLSGLAEVRSNSPPNFALVRCSDTGGVLVIVAVEE